MSKMRRSVENAEHVGLFVRPNTHRASYAPVRIDLSRPFTRSQLLAPAFTPQLRRVRNGVFLPPARATLSSASTSHSQFQTPSVIAYTRAPSILTPSTSAESMRSGAGFTPAQITPVGSGTVDTARFDDPFVGSRTIRRPTTQDHRENIPLLC